MPKRLQVRLKPDTIEQFRLAAYSRFEEGMVLAANDKRTAAIYLWGYVAEMLIKAAYFEFIGHDPAAPITWQSELRPAIDRGRVNFRIAPWPNNGAGHHVANWGQLLVLERAARNPYPSHFGLQVQQHSLRIGEIWSEILRYRKNTAYPFEVDQVRQAVDWFMMNSEYL